MHSHQVDAGLEESTIEQLRSALEVTGVVAAHVIELRSQRGWLEHEGGQDDLATAKNESVNLHTIHAAKV